jgi:hypothetical protein
VGLERGPLSLVSATAELLGRNSSGSGTENRRKRPQGSVKLTKQHPLSASLALTSPTSGGHSVSILRSRHKATEISLVFLVETLAGRIR